MRNFLEELVPIAVECSPSNTAGTGMWTTAVPSVRQRRSRRKQSQRPRNQPLFSSLLESLLRPSPGSTIVDISGTQNNICLY